MDEIFRAEHLKKILHEKKTCSVSTSITVKATDDVSFSLKKGEVFVFSW